MKKTFKIYETPIVLITQIVTLMLFSDFLFFVMLKLVDFANHESLIINILTAKEELIGVIMFIQISIIFYLFLNWINSYYWFEKFSLFYTRGIIWTSTKEYILPELRMATYKQGIWGKLFNFGMIRLHGLDDDTHLSRIPDPKYFIKVINEKRSENN